MSIQDKFNRANVIYKITKDIDLGGETLTIPEGCTLDFQGGSFSNGTIEGNNTAIQANLTKIFGLDVELIGSWNVAEAYPEWFGAVHDGATDDRKAIQCCIDSFNNVIFSHNNYYINSFTDIDNKTCLKFYNNRTIIGCINTASDVKNATLIISESLNPSIVAEIGSNVSLERLSINCNLSELLDDPYKRVAFGTGGKWATNLNIKECSAVYAYIGFDLTTYRSTIQYNYATGCAIGFSIHGKVDANDNPAHDGSFGTSVFYANNYADYCHYIGHKFAALLYSTIFANAADHCGWNDKGITSNGYSYVFTHIRQTSIKGNGTETAYRGILLKACQNTSLCNFSFVANPDVVNIYNENNSYFFRFTDNTGCVIDNITIFAPDNINKTGRIRLESNNNNIRQVLRNIYHGTAYVTDEYLNLVGFASNHKSHYVEYSNVIKSGKTDNRPSSSRRINNNMFYYDENCNKLLFSRDGNWIDMASNDNENQTLLQKAYDNVTNVNNSGWYRIGKILTYGQCFLFLNTTSYNNHPEYYTFIISPFDKTKWNIILLSGGGQDVGTVVDKIRVAKTEEGGFIDIHYNVDKTNGVMYTLIGNTESIKGTLNKVDINETEIYSECKVIRGSKFSNLGDYYRPTEYLSNTDIGYPWFDEAMKKPIWWSGKDWLDCNGDSADDPKSGFYGNKPDNPSVGFAYFCTDRKTVEDTTNGIMIYHKGNNVWVDALGRVVE